MVIYSGIDLGSTTTKAVFMDRDKRVIGKGITDSRGSYEASCRTSHYEAEINLRFTLLKDSLKNYTKSGVRNDLIISSLLSRCKLYRHIENLKKLEVKFLENISVSQEINSVIDYGKAVVEIFQEMINISPSLFNSDTLDRELFFRDITASQFLNLSEMVSENSSISIDMLISLYERSITSLVCKCTSQDFGRYLNSAMEETLKMEEFTVYQEEIKSACFDAINTEFQIEKTIVTGYGRQVLLFPKEQIKSEIICHGLGSHYLFPETRTVLDIGGQDTKGIQIDEEGNVINFQMNDRCAAGCGRYLGYIADEMSIGIHELAPMALKSKKYIKINSTCTVFAGKELHELLTRGESREDILKGIHRSIILKAISLISRTGGIKNEFTFSGGVSRNGAATGALHDIVSENYSGIRINVSPDSIYTGAIGAAILASRHFIHNYNRVN